MPEPSTLIVGCGYLGRRVGRNLARRGKRVFGTTRSAAKAAELADWGVASVIADVTDPATLATLPEVDHVVTCFSFDRSAGLSRRAVYFDGLRSLLAALPASVGRLVHVGSTSVYGDFGGDWVDENSPTEPTTESGQVCLEAEELAREHGRRGGRVVSVLRCSGLYGPGRVIGRAALERGEPIPGDPNRYLNLIHIEDAAQAVVAALDRGQSDRVYNVSDDEPVIRAESYGQAARLLRRPPPVFVPSPETPPDPNRRVRNRRMRVELGVSLNFPTIATGLIDAIGVDRSPPLRSD